MITTLIRFASGRNEPGTESYVFRPMMIAFVVPGVGGRDVTRAKNDMSVFMRGHGSVPFRPMPRRVISSFVVVDAVRIGVVATISVREGRWWGL